MAPEPGTDDGSGGDSNDDDVLDRISQDLDYLLNRKNVGDSNEVESDGDGDADRNQKKKAKDLTLPWDARLVVGIEDTLNANANYIRSYPHRITLTPNGDHIFGYCLPRIYNNLCIMIII